MTEGGSLYPEILDAEQVAAFVTGESGGVCGDELKIIGHLVRSHEALRSRLVAAEEERDAAQARVHR